MVPVGNLAWSLSHIGQVGACCYGRDPGLVVQQESSLDRLPVCPVAVFISFERLPQDDGLISKEQIESSDLFVVGVPTGDTCRCFEGVDEVGGGNGLPRRSDVTPGEVGRLLDDLVLLQSLLHACGGGGCSCGLSHLFLFFGVSGSVAQILQANLFSSQKNFLARQISQF